MSSSIAEGKCNASPANQSKPQSHALRIVVLSYAVSGILKISLRLHPWNILFLCKAGPRGGIQTQNQSSVATRNRKLSAQVRDPQANKLGTPEPHISTQICQASRGKTSSSLRTAPRSCVMNLRVSSSRLGPAYRQ